MEEKSMTEPSAVSGVGAAGTSEESPPSPPSVASKVVKIVVGLAAVGVLIYYGRQAGDYFLDFANWVKGQGPLGPVFFILGYAVGIVAAAPGAILTMLGGAIFGLGWGTAWVFCGATLGSAAAFLIARYVARGMVEKKIEGNRKFAAIDKAVGRQGLKIVFLLRLTPVFPFSLGNYALGLTRVRFVDYLLAAFGTLPGTFLYVYYGKAIGDVAALAAGTEVEKGPGYWVLTGLGLAATIGVTIVVTRIALKALKERTDIEEAPASNA
jgi:uncharacterized membrane protein YdjX (TVP38/TMEM64 family)